MESDLTEVASQAEQAPLTTPAEVKEDTQNQETLQEEMSTETQQAVLQPDAHRTHSGQRRPPKTTPVSMKKKVKKEDGTAAREAPEFQDDPSDADYTPSEYIFIT